MIVDRRQLDGIDRAGLFAHPTIDTAQLVDPEAFRIFLAIGPGSLGPFYMDAIGGTGGLAHKAGDTRHPALFVFIESM